MPNCRLCGSSSDQNVRAHHVYGGEAEYKFWECGQCEAIYLYPYLTESQEKEFYAKEFEKFMSSRVGDHRDWSGAEKHIETNQDQVIRRLKFLEEHLQSGMDILEIGCSSGFMLNEFRNKGLKTTGIEPSGEFLEFVKKAGHNSYESLQELENSEPDKKFDVITHFFVFEHIANPYDFLKETLDLLKPGGCIIAEIPSATDALTSLYSIDAFERFYWSIAHHYYYTPNSLRYVLDKMEVNNYKLLPEQRYDLSNHITWLQDGKPGGQGRYNHVYSKSSLLEYSESLKASWNCDTIILKIFKD